MSKTRKGPLLVGVIRFKRTCLPPGLIFEVWCPYCCDFHSHGWTGGDDLRAVSHRAAHCGTTSPFFPGGYYVGIDKRRKKECEQALADFRAYQPKPRRLPTPATP